MPDLPLTRLFVRPSGDGSERMTLTRDQLQSAFDLAFPTRQELHRDLEITVLQRIATPQSVDAYALQVGSWRIDLPVRLAQSAVSGAILGGAIAITGEASVSVAVLALIMPFLVDVERLEVRTRDRIVRAHLSEGVDVDDPEAAYEALSDELREQLTLLEFADTLDRLRAARLLPDARDVALPLPAVGDPDPQSVPDPARDGGASQRDDQ